MMDSQHIKHRIASTMSPLWSVLTDEEQELFVENAVIRKFNREDVIFKEGEVSTHLLFLLRGKVALYNKGVANRKRLIRMVELHGFFGYQSAFVNTPSQITAIAGSDTSVVMIPMNIVFHLIWENPKVAMFFITELSTMLGISVRQTITLTHKHIRGRLAEVLLHMKKNYGTESDGQTIAVYMSREDLANLSNMTTSNAIRTLSSFAHEGIVQLVGRKIRIIDEEKLKFISNTG